MAALNASPFGPPTDPTTAPLRMFGGPRLVLDEEEVKLSPFQASLMAIVCVHGVTGVSRSRVSWLLWESEDDAPARHRISQLLYGIGARAGAPAILAEGDDLKPSPEVESDLGRLRITGATRPVTGAPLGRLCAPHPTGAFEQWLTTQRTTLRYLAIERNGELLAAAEEMHEYELAADAARALLEYDPINERGLRSLIRAVALGGSALQAETAYERQAEIVRRILPDWKPSRETRRLLGEIDSLRARQAAPPTTRDIQHSVRMVGRKEELTELRHACVEDGIPWRDVMILGEAGIGKSRLLEELARQLDLEDCRVVRIRSFAAEEGIAFNLLSEIARTEPFQEAIRTLAPLWRKILSSALSIEPVDVPEEDLPKVPADSASRRVYEALRHLFDAVEGTVVILADGFGAADSSSLAALSFLRRRVKGSTIRFIGTVGQDTIYGDPGQLRYLQDVLDQVDHKVELEPLDEGEAVKLVEAAGGGLPDMRTLAEVIRLAGGNPLFLIELAQSDHATITKNPAAGASPSLRGLLERRLGSVTPATRALLNVLSAQRGPQSLTELAAICEVGRGEALVCLQEAQGHRLVASDSEGVSFRHGLMKHWTRINLSEAERQFIHRATAAHILRDKDPSYAELAFHYDQAGLATSAFEWATRGAAAAEAHAALPDVVRLLDIAERNAPSNSERLQVLERLGGMLYRQGDLTRAATVYASARECAGSEQLEWKRYAHLQLRYCQTAASIGLHDPDSVLERLMRLKDEANKRGELELLLTICDATLVIAHESMKVDYAKSILTEIETLSVPADSGLLCQLQLLRSFHLVYGDRTTAIASVNEALRLSESESAAHLALRSIARFFIVHCWEADLPSVDAPSLLARMEERARASGEYHALFRALVNLSSAYIDLLELDRAEVLLHRAETLFDRDLDVGLRVSLDANWGEYFLARGMFQEALPHFRYVTGHAGLARRDVLSLATAGVGLCCLETGELGEARRIVSEIRLASYLSEVVGLDPSLMILLHAKWQDRTGKHAEAEGILDKGRALLTRTYVPGWFKITLSLLHLLRKTKSHRLNATLLEAQERADQKNLSEIAKVLGRFGSSI